MTTRQRTSALFGGALVLLFVLLLGSGATNSFGWVFTDDAGRGRLVTDPSMSVSAMTATATPTIGEPGVADKDPLTLPGWIQNLIPILTGVLVVVVLVYIVRYLLTHPPQKRRRRERDVEEGLTVADVELAASLKASAERSLAVLDDTGLAPADAIVHCWRDFVATARNAGLRRRDSDTSTEFTARVLTDSGVDASAAEGLAQLYRQAMFGAWEPGAADVEHARDCLRRIIAQLAPAPAQAPHA